MKTIPMIFNQEMVKALADGRKTVTRRPMKPQPELNDRGYYWWPSKVFETMVNLDNAKGDFYWDGVVSDMCPIASVGDLIWVRETFSRNEDSFVYAADLGVLEQVKVKKTPSIHMPRRASRLTLRVTDIRIERVQDISEEQAIREGIERLEHSPGFFHAYFPLGNKNGLRCCSSAVESFRGLWNVIYDNWKENPWVWVIEFEVIKQNIDSYIAQQEAA